MTGFERFGKLALDKVTPVFDRLDQNVSEIFEQLGQDPTKEISSKLRLFTSSNEENFYLEIFNHFDEVKRAVETLEYIPFFIKSFRKSKAYQEAGIKNTDYLRYHVEHYIQENYILLSRVKTFMGWLSHSLKNEGRIRESLFVSRLLKTFEGSMKNLKEVRTDHVHKRRYDDEVLSISTVFESSSIVNKEVEVAATRSYKSARKEQLDQIKKNNQDLKKNLDQMAEQLIPIVFPSAKE